MRLATTDTVRVLLEIGVGIANDQCPAAVRGGAVIEAEVEEIDTVEVWWHTHGALSIARSQFRQDDLRIVWSWVQAAVSRVLWDVLFRPSLRGVVAQRRAGLDAGGQLLGAPQATATTRQTRTAEAPHGHDGFGGRGRGSPGGADLGDRRGLSENHTSL